MMPVQRLDTWKKRIRSLKRQLGSFRAVARALGLSHGTVIRIAHGYEPKAAHIRRALGLPIYETILLCARCGRRHDEIKTCPDKRQQRQRARLRDLPTAELARRIRERIDYAPTDEQRATVAVLLKNKQERLERLRYARHI